MRVLDHRELLARQEAARRAAHVEMRREAVSQAEAAVARAEEAAAGLEEEAIAHERAAAEARRRCEELQRRAVAALQEKVRAGSSSRHSPSDFLPQLETNQGTGMVICSILQVRQREREEDHLGSLQVSTRTVLLNFARQLILPSQPHSPRST